MPAVNTARTAPLTTRDIVYIALFATIMAALAVIPPINLATGVPITSQTLGVGLAGAILGARRGGLAMLLFLLLVALGLPLLVGGRGGAGVFAGPTGGFLVAWPVAAYLIGLLTERYWQRLTVPVAFGIIFLTSVVVMYSIGNAWLSYSANMPFLKALLASGPFLPGDALKALIAAFAAVTVKRANPIIRPAPVAAAR